VSDASSLWEETAREVRAGNAAALATVSRHRGSLPMATDAKMLVTASGRRTGTVGGGCVEADVIQQAMESLASGVPGFARHTLNADIAGDLGLSCGGTVEFFIEPVPLCIEMELLCTKVASGVANREFVSVFTSLDWSGGPAKMATVGAEVYRVGEAFPVPDVARGTPAADGRASAFLAEEHSCFVENIKRRPRLIIFGAGHVGKEIARLASRVGFYVVVIDDREEFANERRLPEANEVIAGDFMTTLSGLLFDGDDYVLATTRGHSFDANIIQAVAGTPAGYVGMLGSRRKKAVLWKALAASGVPEDALNRVHCPIGLDIGADNPDEIAVSVVAELIHFRRHRDTANEGLQFDQ